MGILKSISLNRSQKYWLVFFILCRLTILLFYEAYVTDVAYYLEIAQQGLANNAKAYQDFTFEYPPLALLFTYLPAFFSHWEFWSYWRAFRAQMFLIDIGIFLWVYYYLTQKLKVSDDKLRLFVGLYCFLGFLVGHLLYDRLDLLILASLFALFYSYSVAPTQIWLLRAVSLIGVFVKFVPFLYALVLNLLNHFSLSPSSEQRSAQWKNLLRIGSKELLWLLMPFFTLLALYEMFIARGVFTDLNRHLQRGIQVESTWATPLIVPQLFHKSSGSYIAHNFGAQHLDESRVPIWYLELSKMAGLLVLSAFGLYLFLVLLPRLRTKRQKYRANPNFACLIWLNIFGIFLSTQRVLSPQFFIWLMLPLALLPIFKLNWTLLTLTLLTYLLTYIGFDLGYWQFVAGNPFFVSVVATRNILLVMLTVVSIRQLSLIENDPT